jgi:peroxiredoxin Q/BCP
LSAAGPAFSLKAGDKAPLFELPSTTGDKISLADYVGKKPVVLFFYVGAFTKT